jgi:biotin carboxyl carrier protein
MAQEIFPLEMHYDSSAGKYYPSRIFEYKKYYKPWTQEGNQAIDSLIAAGIINPNVNRDRKSPTLFRDMRNITLYPGSGWKFEQTAITRGGVVKIGRLVRETKPGQTFPNNYEIPKNIETELRNQYENIVKLEPRAAYRGRQSDLNAIFNQQARELAGAGVSNIANLRSVDGKLVDTTTNTVINNISRDRDTGADKWGDIFSGVEGGANYGVSFAADGSPIFYPVYEKGKSPLAQIGLGGLESVITPILTIAGVAIGIPGLGPVASAALGAAGGNTVGQLLATGDVDWEQVVKASATASLGAVGSTTYATSVGNALGIEGAGAVIAGNAVINSALSGIEAVVSGGNVEKSMLAGAIRGAAIVGAEDFANAVLGEGTVADIAKLSGLENKQVASIFTTSVANGVTAEISGQGEFLETIGISLAAQGIGAKSANLMQTAMKDVLDKDPEIMASVLTATGGIATTATNAALRGEDVGKALENSAPGIILSSVQAYQAEADRQDEIKRKQEEAAAAQREKELGAVQQPPATGDALEGAPPIEGEGAGEVSLGEPPLQVAGDELGVGTTLDILEAMKREALSGIDEKVVQRDILEEDGVTYEVKVVQGVKDDGSLYEYNIIVDQDGSEVFYEWSPSFTEKVASRERPDLRSAPSETAVPSDRVNLFGTTQEDLRPVAVPDEPPIVVGIDLRKYGDPSLGGGDALFGLLKAQQGLLKPLESSNSLVQNLLRDYKSTKLAINPLR